MIASISLSFDGVQTLVVLGMVFLFGTVVGIWLAKRIIVTQINKADLCSDDKCMIRQVLGIEQNERE